MSVLSLLLFKVEMMTHDRRKYIIRGLLDILPRSKIVSAYFTTREC